MPDSPRVRTGGARPTATRVERKEHFMALDGLRGVAALCVVIYHVAIIFGTPQILPHAMLSVDLFFILSGFVISYAYDDDLNAGEMSVIDFIVQRAIRLYPLIVFGVTLGLINEIIKSPAEGLSASSLPNFALGIMSLPKLIGHHAANIDPLDPPGWSLFFEIFASIFYVATHKYLYRHALCAIITVLVICHIIIILYTHNENLGFTIGTFWFGFPRVLATFLIGVLLQRGRKATIPLFIIPAAAPGAIAILVFCFSDNIAHVIIYSLGATPLIFPILVYIGSFTIIKTNWEMRICRILGNISYPIYILHWPIFVILISITNIEHINMINSRVPFGVLSLVASIVIAQLISTLYDEPIRRKLRMLWRSHRWQKRL